VSRDEIPGWFATFSSNVRRLQQYQNTPLDVIFYGDEIVEGWNGHYYNKPSGQDGQLVAQFWNKTFESTSLSPPLTGVALGITSDSVSEAAVKRCTNILSHTS
jgi:hypothetical protein